jgi:uncharacterized caspase-like protein
MIKSTIIFIFLFLTCVAAQAQKQLPKLILPTGHLGGVTKLDVSPNKRLLLTEDLNSDIIIIESDKLIELQRHNFGKWKINSSTFLNDSSIISICNDTLISVWNFYSDKDDLYPISVHLNKLYVEKHGLYCIDNQGVVFRFQISEKQTILKEFVKDKATEVYFKSEKEIFLVNGNNLIFSDLNRTKKLKRKFDNEITALSWNSIGNVLLGFDNGEILECDSSLEIVHNYNSISDRISVIGYVSDTIIISGSYDFSVVTQNKKEILNSILFDDWTVGMVMKNREIITCKWNGMVNRINENLEIKNDFEAGLKKATFFCQRENNLFISYNDGGVCHFDVNTNQLINSHYISSTPILGIDANHSSSELIIWNSNGVSVFDLSEKKIKSDFKRFNIVSAKFIPNTSKYIFCSTEFLYYFNNNQTLDSIPLIDSWSIMETKENSIIASGLNRIIEVGQFEPRVINLNELGQIWTTQKNIDSSFLLGTSNSLYQLINNGKRLKIADFTMIIDGIEFIDKEKLIINCENGQLLKVDLNSKKIKIIADTKQDYGSWDFKYNNNTGKIIYPNAKSWDFKMDVDVLDLNGKLLNKLENVGGQVVCISNSNKSIEFNHLDSNKVMFIVSDGSVKLWDINSDGKSPITQLGFDYYNLLKDQLKDFNMNGAFLKSGLLKLPLLGLDTLTFMNLKNGDWLVHDSKFRFDGTSGAIEKLYFTCGLDIVELNQIKDSLYVPNLVQRYKNGETLEHIPQIKDLQICGYTPLVEPIDSLNYRIIPRNGGVGEVAVFINGIQRFTFDTRNLQLEKGIYRLNISEREINPFREMGKSVQIKVVAKTADNSVSSRGAVVEITNNQTQTQLKPAIHAIMIGVDQYKDESLQLNYAAKDANDLQVILQLACKNYFNVDDTNRVFFYNLTINSEGKTGTNNIRGITPDRGNIIKTLQEIEKTSKPEDIILLFFAGHGEIVEKEQLLLLTSESTRDNFQGIKMNELLTMMNEIPAGKRVLILDACHSGAAINNLDMTYYSGKRDVKDAERESQRLKELDKLANKSGFAIITASSSDQKALELPQYEHGLLTYSLLSALVRNKSVLTDDNQLVLEKWFIAAEEEMIKLNKDQNSEKMMPISFNLGIVNDEVKQSIQITEIPMMEIGEVINENQFINELFPLDNLEIEERIKSSFQVLNESKNQKIYLLESGGNTNYKLIIKYSVLNNDIKIKCNIIKNGAVIFKLERTTDFEKLNSVISSLTKEIVTLL